MDDNVIHEQVAHIAQAFANPLRLRILDLLVQHERSVEEIRLALATPLTSVSSHLKVLRETRLVETRRDGVKIFYRLAGNSVAAAIHALRDVAEQRSLAVQEVVREFLDEHRDMTQIDANELMRLMHSGEAVLIDVRPRDEFESGHIPGAVSMPLADIDARVGELSGDARVVAYCRDAYCVLAPEAVSALRRFGVSTDRLDIGFSEWSAAGRLVERHEHPEQRKAESK